MHDHDIVLLCEGDDLLVDLRRADRPHRVSRKRDDHVLGLVRHVVGNVCHMREEPMLCCQLVVVRGCSCKLRAGTEDRIAGIGDEGDVARICQGCTDILHAFLRAAAAHDLVGLEAIHIEAALVVVADRLLELILVMQGILPVRIICAGVDKCLLDVVRRREIGRADRQVPDRTSRSFKLAALLVQTGKDLVSEKIETLRKLHRLSRSPAARRRFLHTYRQDSILLFDELPAS